MLLPRVARNGFIAVAVILLWSLFLILCFDFTLTTPVHAKLQRHYPIRSWTKTLKFQSARNETLHFKDERLNFRILQFPEALTPLCEAGNLTLLVIVQSAPKSADIRKVIRETWAATGAIHSLKSDAAKVVFLIGDGSAPTALQAEIDQNKDIILVDTEDSYKNLVYKTAISLFISHTHCPTPYLLKIDEDVAFNVGSTFWHDHAAIYCKVRYVSMPWRNKTSRWYVSQTQYDGWFYPRYCAGPAYVLTSEAVDSLLFRLPEFEVIRIEDVFFTGIVASAAEVKRIGMQGRFKTEYTAQSFSASDCSTPILAVHNLKKEAEIRDTWRYLSRDC